MKLDPPREWIPNGEGGAGSSDAAAVSGNEDVNPDCSMNTSAGSSARKKKKKKKSRKNSKSKGKRKPENVTSSASSKGIPTQEGNKSSSQGMRSHCVLQFSAASFMHAGLRSIPKVVLVTRENLMRLQMRDHVWQLDAANPQGFDDPTFEDGRSNVPPSSLFVSAEETLNTENDSNEHGSVGGPQFRQGGSVGSAVHFCWDLIY